MRIVNTNPQNEDGSKPIYTPGNEPDNIKKRIETLFAKLDEAYPDYIIVSLSRDHKKWGETVTELYRVLGYDNGNSFLEAYGYSVQSAKTGRKSSTDVDEIICELKSKYSDGPRFIKMADLIADNPDLAGKIKTISNKSNELFGTSLKTYFEQIGLLISSETVAAEKQQAKILESEKKKLEKEEEKHRREIEKQEKQMEAAQQRLYAAINVTPNDIDQASELCRQIESSLTIEKYLWWSAFHYGVDVDELHRIRPEQFGIDSNGIIQIKKVQGTRVREELFDLLNETNNILMKKVYRKSVYDYAYSLILSSERSKSNDLIHNFENVLGEYYRLCTDEADLMTFTDYSKVAIVENGKKMTLMIVVDQAVNLASVFIGQSLAMYMDSSSARESEYQLAVTNIENKFVGFISGGEELFQLKESKIVDFELPEVVFIDKKLKKLFLRLSVSINDEYRIEYVECTNQDRFENNKSLATQVDYSIHNELDGYVFTETELTDEVLNEQAMNALLSKGDFATCELLRRRQFFEHIKDNCSSEEARELFGYRLIEDFLDINNGKLLFNERINTHIPDVAKKVESLCPGDEVVLDFFEGRYREEYILKNKSGKKIGLIQSGRFFHELVKEGYMFFASAKVVKVIPRKGNQKYADLVIECEFKIDFENAYQTICEATHEANVALQKEIADNRKIRELDKRRKQQYSDGLSGECYICKTNEFDAWGKTVRVIRVIRNSVPIKHAKLLFDLYNEVGKFDYNEQMNFSHFIVKLADKKPDKYGMLYQYVVDANGRELSHYDIFAYCSLRALDGKIFYFEEEKRVTEHYFNRFKLSNKYFYEYPKSSKIELFENADSLPISLTEASDYKDSNVNAISCIVKKVLDRSDL